MWRPAWSELNLLPQSGDLVLAADTRAGCHYGIPMNAAADYPWDLYATDVRTANRIILQCQKPGAGLVVTPIAAVGEFHQSKRGEPYSYVHPVVVALDLAPDVSRGAETINNWSAKNIRRVW